MQIQKMKRPSTSLFLWIATAVLFVAAIVPTLLKYMPVGHDVIYHCMRLLNIAEEMRHGNPFPTIYTYALNGMGYGAPLFYSDLFLYPFALLNALGVSIYWTFKILQASLLVMSFVSMYWVGKALFKDCVQAQVTALAYSFSFYSLMDIYYRAAIGECFTFVFLPVVYLGYYRITHDREDCWWILALGMLGILLSHTLSVILAMIFLIVLILFDFKYWIRHLSHIRYMVYAALLCIGLGCYFWLPMLEQLTQLSFRLNLDVTNAQGRFWSSMYNPLRLLATPIISAIVKPNEPVAFVRLTGTVGYLAIMVGLAASWKNRRRSVCLMMVVSLVFVWLSGRYSPTQLLAETPLATLQFPWRILLCATMALALFIGMSMASIRSTRWKNIFIGLVVVSAATSIYCNFPSDQYSAMVEYAARYDHTFESFFDFHMNKNEVSDGQYLPDDLEYVMAGNLYAYYPPEFEARTSDDAVEFSLSRDDQNHLVCTFSGNPGGATIDVPVILYIGYTAELSDGTPLEVSRGDSGMVRVSLGDHASGEFILRYEGTTIQKVSGGVTIVTLAAFAALMLLRRRKAKAPAEQ